MSVKVKDLLKISRLSQEYGDNVLLEKEIKTSDISRPGLERVVLSDEDELS